MLDLRPKAASMNSIFWDTVQWKLIDFVCYLLHVCFLCGLFCDTADGGDMLLQTKFDFYQTTHVDDRILEIHKKFSSLTGATVRVQTDGQTDKT
jgi:hypothetical protein